MKQEERLLWAIGIVVLDLLVFALPLTALFIAYVILKRPPWFKDWVEKFYEGA